MASCRTIMAAKKDPAAWVLLGSQNLYRFSVKYVLYLLKHAYP